MEVRLNIDEQELKTIAESLGKDLGSDVKATEITREALAVYKWAAQQRRKGLEIFAADSKGPKEKVITPLLSSVLRK